MTPTNKEYTIKTIRELVLNFPDELLDEFCKSLPQYIREVRGMKNMLSAKMPGITITHNLFDELVFRDDDIEGTTAEIDLSIRSTKAPTSPQDNS